MRYRLNDEFEALYEEYQDATSVEDRKIRLKLNEIAGCYGECGIQERTFADEIVKKFCELIQIFKEQHKGTADYEFGVSENANKFMIANTDKVPYCSDEELLNAFYHFYRQEMSEATIKDYVARVNTFARNYLFDIPCVRDLWVREEEKRDVILFVYKYLDLIIANFNTNNENGDSVKQKINIRSALKKLNEFKHLQEVEKYINAR